MRVARDALDPQKSKEGEYAADRFAFENGHYEGLRSNFQKMWDEMAPKQQALARKREKYRTHPTFENRVNALDALQAGTASKSP